MTTKKRGLGRGLDALLADIEENDTVDQSQLQHLAILDIQPGKYQPRIDMSQDSLEELAASIQAQGLVQPIIVRAIEHADASYEIIAVERRWRACQLAEMTTIPAIIRNVPDSSAIAMALIENIQREDLNPMEEAHALYRLKEEFAMTHQQTADAVGRSRAMVSNLLRLRNLNPVVQRLVENGDIEMGHARALLALAETEQSVMAQQIIAKSLSVREAERAIRKQLHVEETATAVDVDAAQILKSLEQTIKQKLLLPFKLKHSEKGNGQLIIHYRELAEIERLVRNIK